MTERSLDLSINVIHSQSARSEWKPVVLLAVIGCLISFPVVMTTLAPYDDEGYVMMTLRTFGQGERLYGSTHTQYGPAFYFLTESLHSFFRVPLTHDGIRLKTIALWSATTLLCYASLRRMAVSGATAFVASIAFHMHLDKFALEPGHPQEWILLLNLIAVWIVAGSSRWKWAMAATCVALIGMIKLNWGAVSGAALFLQAIVVSVRDQKFRWAWVQVIAAGCLTSICILIATRVAGSTWNEIAWGLVGQHRRFATEFFHPIPWQSGGLVFFAISTGLWVTRSKKNANRSALYIAVLGMCGGAILLLLDFARPLVHGLEPRGAAPWLVLAGPAVLPWLFTQRNSNSQVAWFLSSLALFGPLTAYPTPGTQLTIATAPSWLIFAVSIGESFSIRNIHVAMDRIALAKPMIQCCKWAMPLLRFVNCCALIIIAAPHWFRWSQGERLIAQGASLIRLDSNRAASEQGIANAIQNTGCRFVVFDGHTHNRFYFWLDKQPLTAANPTFWPRMLSSDERVQWQERVRKVGKLCVVRPPESNALAGDFARELRADLLANWKQTDQINGWRIGIVNADTD